MPRFPKVSRREKAVLAIMLVLLYGALGYLYVAGEMSMLGIGLVTGAGLITVWGSVWFYAQLWDDID